MFECGKDHLENPLWTFSLDYLRLGFLSTMNHQLLLETTVLISHARATLIAQTVFQ